MGKRAPNFTGVRKDGDSFFTFYEGGGDLKGRLLAFWFRESGLLLDQDGRLIGPAPDINEAGRLITKKYWTD